MRRRPSDDYENAAEMPEGAEDQFAEECWAVNAADDGGFLDHGLDAQSSEGLHAGVEAAASSGEHSHCGSHSGAEEQRPASGSSSSHESDVCDPDGQEGGEEEMAPHHEEDLSPMEEPPQPPKRGDPARMAELSQQLRLLQKRLAQREAVVPRLRGRIQELQNQTFAFLREESHALGEAGDVRQRADSSEEALRQRHAVLTSQLETHQASAVARQAKEREWRADIQSMVHQQQTADDRATELEKTLVQVRKNSAAQAQRVKRSEGKLRTAEARRSEIRMQCERWLTESNRWKQACSQERESSQRIRREVQHVDFEMAARRQQWQVVSGMFLLLLLLLVFGQS